jgi:nitrite reductase/ring-hydroxylating ferredoxin subunit
MDLTRREFVAGITASCLLCGCSSSEKSPQSGGTQGEPQSAPPPAAENPAPRPAGTAVPMPPGLNAPGDQAKVMLPGEGQVLVWKDQVGFHGVAARCTHRGSQVFYDKDRNDIRCPEHGSRFFVDGAVENGPAKMALKAYKVEVEGESLRLSPKE